MPETTILKSLLEGSGKCDLSTTKSVAVIVRTPSEASYYKPWEMWAASSNVTVDIIPLEPPLTKNGKIFSFFYHPPRPCYDLIIVHRKIELFEHCWSYSFLSRVNSLLTNGGLCRTC